MRALAVAAVLAGGVAHADVRSFTRTWEYSTVPEGKTTIDLWHTQNATVFEGTLEVEHGITDSLDLALFTTFVDVAGGNLGLAQTKAMGRYRFVERAEWPVDTMVQIAAAKDFGTSRYRFEGRLVGARDFDRILVAANAAVEVAAGKDVDGAELVYSAALGASYTLHPTFKLGAESWGSIEEDRELLAAGPVANWFPTSSFWITFGAGFGLTGATEDYAFRAILGIEL